VEEHLIKISDGVNTFCPAIDHSAYKHTIIMQREHRFMEFISRIFFKIMAIIVENTAKSTQKPPLAYHCVIFLLPGFSSCRHIICSPGTKTDEAEINIAF